MQTTTRHSVLSLLVASTVGIGCAGSPPAASDADAQATSSSASGVGAGGTGGAGGGAGGGAEPASPADRAFAWLHGTFDSKEQAAADPSYYPVQLRTCVVDAPELGARVLYIEQALLTKVGSPYRQRLYVVEDGEAATAVSQAYDLVAPKAAVGLCDAASPATFAAGDAVLQKGCAVRLTWDEASATFAGGTEGTGCESTLNGASYATSEVVLASDALQSWDRGYAPDGKQVWGATKGAYRFVRRTPLEP